MLEKAQSYTEKKEYKCKNGDCLFSVNVFENTKVRQENENHPIIQYYNQDDPLKNTRDMSKKTLKNYIASCPKTNIKKTSDTRSLITPICC